MRSAAAAAARALGVGGALRTLAAAPAAPAPTPALPAAPPGEAAAAGGHRAAAARVPAAAGAGAAAAGAAAAGVAAAPAAGGGGPGGHRGGARGGALGRPFGEAFGGSALLGGHREAVTVNLQETQRVTRQQTLSFQRWNLGLLRFGFGMQPTWLGTRKKRGGAKSQTPLQAFPVSYTCIEREPICANRGWLSISISRG